MSFSTAQTYLPGVSMREDAGGGTQGAGAEEKNTPPRYVFRKRVWSRQLLCPGNLILNCTNIPPRRFRNEAKQG